MHHLKRNNITIKSKGSSYLLQRKLFHHKLSGEFYVIRLPPTTVVRGKALVDRDDSPVIEADTDADRVDKERKGLEDVFHHDIRGIITDEEV